MNMKFINSCISLKASQVTLVSILVAVLGPYSSISWASPCSTVRFDRDGAFAKIPTYNQLDPRGQDTDMCYAFVAAELIDAYRFSHGDALNGLTSPLSLALNYKINLKNHPERNHSFGESTLNVLGNGSIHQAIEENRGEMVCDQKRVVSIYPKNSFYDSSLGSLAGLRDDLNRRCENGFFKIEIGSGKLNSYFSGYKGPDSDRVPDNNSLFRMVNSILSASQPAPVAIGFCNGVLRGEDNCLIQNHTAVIIGQRAKGDSCEYLIRNSEGASCPYKYPCEKDGSVWVPEDTLIPTVDQIFWMSE